MDRIFIIHYNPIDKYPPACNLVRQLDTFHSYSLQVFTTGSSSKNIFSGQSSQRLRITTFSDVRSVEHRWIRAFAYLYFHFFTLFMLVLKRPRHVIYYETLSSLAPVLFKLYFSKSANLFIHYHEYKGPEEYSAGMRFERICHRLEEQVYGRSAWISHTNAKRLQMFMEDHSLNDHTRCHIMPNYPPQSWAKSLKPKERIGGNRLAFVYVGALSLKTMYTESFARMVASCPDKCLWHIYSATYDDEVMEFLESLNAGNITFKGPVSYDLLPDLLPGYDIGVILYKGLSANFRYNAPNKFFEYLACGLNVWSYLDLQEAGVDFQDARKPWVRKIDARNELLPAFDEGIRSNQQVDLGLYAENAFHDLLQELRQAS